MALPKTKEHRSKLLSYINEAVEYLKEQDTLKEDVDNAKDIIREEFDIPKAEINLMIQAAYDVTKLVNDIEKRATAISNLEIIQNLDGAEEDDEE